MSRLTLSYLFVLAAIPALCGGSASITPDLAPATSTYEAATSSPDPTDAPIKPDFELHKRQNSYSVGADGFNTTIVPPYVCGYVGGVWSWGATCSASSTCFWDQNSQIVGCCTTKGVCTSGIYTSCYDGSGVKGADSPYVYTCAGDKVCYLNTYVGTSRSLYKQYGCGFANQSTTIYQTFSNMPTTVVLPIYYSTFNYDPSAAASTTGASTSSTAKPTHSAAAKATSHTGAIVGGAVGGVAVIALIGALIFFCLRRRRVSQHPVYQPEPTFVSPPPEKLPPSPYNGHYSYATSQGGTTLVSPPHSPQPPSDAGHGSYLGRQPYSDSPRSDHVGVYTPGHGHHGSDVGSDYISVGGSQYQAFSPMTSQQIQYAGLGMQMQGFGPQEIGGTGVEAPRYEMEHPPTPTVARKAVGSPRAIPSTPTVISPRG